MRQELPLLLQAAAAYALAAAIRLPFAWLLAIASLLLLCWRGSTCLLPFLLAGHVASIDVEHLDGCARTGGLATLFATVETPTRVTLNGRRATDVVVTRPVDVARCRARRCVLFEPEDAAHHARGDELAIEGELVPARPPENPGLLDVTGPIARVVAARVVLMNPDGPSPWRAPWTLVRRAIDRVADSIEQRLNEALPPPAAALADALVLGRTAALDPELRLGLKGIGAWHYLAVSGAHVVLVAALAAWLLHCLPMADALRSSLIAVAIFFYALLSGGEAPALRAAIGFLGSGISLPIGRRSSSSVLLAAAFLVLAAADPATPRQAGFQLSFVAVLALAVAARARPLRSPRGTGTGIDLAKPLLQALRFAWAAGIATTPLTAFHFGSVAPFAPLATLLLAPIVTVALTLSLLAAASSALPLGCTKLFGWPLARGAELFAFVTRELDRLPATPWLVARPDVVTVALLVASWFFLLARRPALAACAVALTLVCAAWLDPLRPPALVMLSVGHGQAVLLRNESSCDLFDAGGKGADNLAPDTFAALLRELDVAHLDGLFLSHLDDDHAGFAAAVIENFDVDSLVLPESERAEWLAPSPSALVGALRASQRARPTKVRFLSAGDAIGPYRCLWPPRQRAFAARNEGCLVIEARCGDDVVLMPGDLEGYPLVELARSLARTYGLVVLPHHGNADPGTALLLARARPRVALASRSDLRFPESTESALRAASTPWLSTACGGAIEFLAPREGEPSWRVTRAARVR